MQHQVPPGFQPLDPGRVNASDPVELQYWCDRFGCERGELERVLRRVGEHVTEVRDALAAEKHA